jgi:anti-sigma B factor antagonist
LLHVTAITNIPILQPEGRFDAHTIAPMHTWLDENQDAANIVVDLSQVTFLDSMALATLVQGAKQCQQKNGNLHLAELRPSVNLIIQLNRLDKVFAIYADVPTAVSAFSHATNQTTDG